MPISLENNIDKQPIVLIVTGPCASGKTAITNLIVQNTDCYFRAAQPCQ